MDNKELIEKKRALEEQMKAIRKEFKEKGKSIIVAVLTPVFEKFPAVRAIQWPQYTPYFNDGDSCTFSSHHDYPNVQLEEDGDFEEAGEESDAISEALAPFTDDDMEAIFGDHKEVTIKRDGSVEVDSYDHD